MSLPSFSQFFAALRHRAKWPLKGAAGLRRWLESLLAPRVTTYVKRRRWQVGLEQLETRLAPATYIWDGRPDLSGTSANANWNNPENWVGDAVPDFFTTADEVNLEFPSGAAQFNVVNDIVGARIDSITINDTGDPDPNVGYNLGFAVDAATNAITLGNMAGTAPGQIRVTSTRTSNTISFDIALSGSSGNASMFLTDAASNLTLSGQISGNNGVTLLKSGTNSANSGTLILSGDNSGFQGAVNVLNGVLEITDANALGDAGPGFPTDISHDTTVQANAQLRIFIGTAGSHTINENLLLLGPGPGNDGALLNMSNLASTVNITGSVRLDADTTIGVGRVQSTSAGTLVLQGVVSDQGTHNLTKVGPGKLTLAPITIDGSGNTYDGRTFVNGGILAISHPLALGMGGTGADTVVNHTLNTSGTLSLEYNPAVVMADQYKNYALVQRLTFNGVSAGAAVVLSAGNAMAPSYSYTGGAGDAALIANRLSSLFGGVAGTAVVNFVSPDVYDAYWAGNMAGLGSPAIDVSVPTGSVSRQTLTNTIQVGFQVPDEILTVNGFGNAGVMSTPRSVATRTGGSVGAEYTGVLSNQSGENSWESTINLWTDATQISQFGQSTFYEPAVTIGALQNSSLTINSIITDNNLGPANRYSFSKVGFGRLILTQANDFAADVDILQGVLNIRDSQALGQATAFNKEQWFGASLELQTDGQEDSVTTLRDANGNTVVPNFNVQIDDNIRINGPTAPTTGMQGSLANISGVNTVNGNLSMQSSSSIGVAFDPDPFSPSRLGQPWGRLSQLTVNGTISGANIAKIGLGELVLTAANTYSGTTSINAGWVTIQNNQALGTYRANLGETAQPGTTIANGAALHLKQDLAGNDLNLFENLTLTGNGITHYSSWLDRKGALVNLQGQNLATGKITISGAGGTGNAGIGVELDGAGANVVPVSQLILTGIIGEATGIVGGVTKLGSQRLIIQGEGAYRGAVNISEGVLRIQNDTALGHDPSATTTTTVQAGAALELAPTVASLNGGIAAGLEIWGEQLILNGTGNSSFGSAPLTVTSDDNAWRESITLRPSITVTFTSGAPVATMTRDIAGLPGATLTVATTTEGGNGALAVQTLTFQGTSLAGNFTLSHNGTPTNPITFSPIPSVLVENIQTELDILFGPGATLVSSNSPIIDVAPNSRLIVTGIINDTNSPMNNGSDLTIRGGGELSLGGTNTYRGTTFIEHGLVAISNAKALGAGNVAERQRIQFAGADSSTMFTLSFNGSPLTGPIPYNDLAAVKTALDALATIGGISGSVTVTGTADDFTITLGGNLSGFDQPELAAAVVAGPGTIGVTTERDGGGGTIAEDGTQLQLSGSISIAGEALKIQGLGNVLQPEVQSVTLSGASAGTFTLTFAGQTTSPLSFGATAAQVSAAINALSSVAGVDGQIDVVKTSPDNYLFFFRGSFNAVDQTDQIAVSTSGGTGEVQTIDLTGGNPTGSQFTLSFEGRPITNVNSAGLIVVTSALHGLATGASVTITGVFGNTAANGAYTITVIDNNTFSLDGTTANGVWTGGGYWTAGGAIQSTDTGNPIAVTSLNHGLGNGATVTVTGASNALANGNFSVTSGGAITSASAANPIVITTSANHNLQNGDRVLIEGVTGDGTANGIWLINNVTANTFEIPVDNSGGSMGTGGTWRALDKFFLVGVDGSTSAAGPGGAWAVASATSVINLLGDATDAGTIDTQLSTLPNIVGAGGTVEVVSANDGSTFIVTFGGGLTGANVRPLIARLISSPVALAITITSADGVPLDGTSATVSNGGTRLNVPLRWFSIGPAPITNGQTTGALDVSGRITGVAVDPTDPNVVYVSTAGGGVWKTVNALRPVAEGPPTWTPLFDDYTVAAPNEIRRVAVELLAGGFQPGGSFELLFSGEETSHIQTVSITDAVQTVTNFNVTFAGQTTADIAFRGNSEVQTISLAGAQPGVTQFTVSFPDMLPANTSAPILYTGDPDIDRPAIEAELNTLVNNFQAGGTATVSGGGAGSAALFVITFGGTLATANVSQTTAAVSSGPGSSGSATVRTGGAAPSTVTDQAVMQAHMSALALVADEGGAVTVNLQRVGTTEIYTMTFGGTLTGTAPDVTIGAVPGPVAPVNVTFNSGKLPWGATAAQVQNSLNALPGIISAGGSVTVTAAPGVAEVQSLILTGATAGTTQFTLGFNGQTTTAIRSGNQHEVQTFAIQNATPNVTQYRLEYGPVATPELTPLITYTGNPATDRLNLQNQLNLLPSIIAAGRVTVSGGSTGSTSTFVITFGSTANEIPLRLPAGGVSLPANGTLNTVFNGGTAATTATDAALIQTHLNALASVGGLGGSVAVVAAVHPGVTNAGGTTFLVTFGGTLSIGNQSQITATISTAPGRLTSYEVTPGQSPAYTITFGGSFANTNVATPLNINVAGNLAGAVTTTVEGNVTPHSVLFGGAIAVAPSDPRIVYFATGEGNNSADSFYGSGVYKSTDSGRTWTLLTDLTSATPNPFVRLAVNKIVVDPLDPDLIYVASSDRAANGVSGIGIKNQPTDANAGIWRYNGTWFNLTNVVSSSRSTFVSSRTGAAAPVPLNTPGPDDDYTISFPQLDVSWSDLAIVHTRIGNNGAGPLATGTTPVLVATLGTTPGVVAHASNASQIVITTPLPHGLTTGMRVNIAGVLGNTSANGDFNILVLTPTTFALRNLGSLLPVPGNGAYTNGGYWRVVGSVGGASNSSPITISSTAHGLVNGDQVTITGVNGNTAANGTWRIANVTANTFELVGSAGNNNYTSGGLWTKGSDNYNGVFRIENPQTANATTNKPSWYVGDPRLNTPTTGTPEPDSQVNGYPNNAGNAKLTVFRQSAPTTLLNNTILYVADATPGDGSTPVVRRSPDGGKTWTVGGALPANFLMDAYYNNSIAVDPSNSAIVYVAGRETNQNTHAQIILRSDNSAGSWRDISQDGGIGPRSNVHSMVVDGNGRLLVATDGGLFLWVSTGPSTGQWTELSGNLAITQFNGVSSHPSNPNTILGGSQSNGAEIYNYSQTWQITDPAQVAPGRGDGGAVFFDPNSPLFAYHLRNGILVRSSNGGFAWPDLISGNFPGSDHNVQDFVIDTINTSRLVAGASNNGAFVLETTDRGQNWTNLLAPIPVTSLAIAAFQGTFVAELVAPFNNVADKGADTYDPDTIYITDGTSIAVTKNHGVNWVIRNAPLSPNTLISDIVVDPTNRDTVYITTTGFSGTDGVGHVFRTTTAGVDPDGGGPLAAWEDISGGLPDLPTWKLVIDPRNGNLYVGTDDGIWRREPGVLGAWEKDWGVALPRVAVHDLDLNLTTNTITAGTYGRSMFQFHLDDLQADSGALRALSGTNQWNGPLVLTGPLTISANGIPGVNAVVPAQLTLNGSISDEVAGSTLNTFDKKGLGKVFLLGDNSYSGETNILEGVLVAGHKKALGDDVSGTTVTPGTALEIQSDIDEEPLKLDSEGILFNGHWTGGLRSVSDNNTYAGPITILRNAVIGVDAGFALTIGAETGLNGAGSITDGTFSFGLIKELTGTLILNTANTYDGRTVIQQGALRVEDNDALGHIDGPTDVLDGAQLQVQSPAGGGALTISEKELNLSGTGVQGGGALLNTSGSNTWAGKVVLRSLPAFLPSSAPQAVVAIGVTQATDTLTIDGVIEDAVASGISKVGAGRLLLSEANIYTGTTYVDNGVLAVSDPNALGNTAAPEIQRVTVLHSGAGTFRLTFNGQTTVPLAFNAPAVGANEVQRVTLTGAAPSATFFRLTFNTQTAAIEYTGTAADLLAIENALNALLSIGGAGGFVTVTYGGGPGVFDVFDIEFKGAFASQDVLTQVTAQLDSGPGGPFGQATITNGAANGSVQGLLNALTTIGGPNGVNGAGGWVNVTLLPVSTPTPTGSVNTNVYTVTLMGSLAGSDQQAMTPLSFGGATASVTTAADGGFGTVVRTGPGMTAALELDGSVAALTMAPEILVLNGAGIAPGTGALYNTFGNNTWTGPISLQTNTSIGVASGTQLRVEGTIRDLQATALMPASLTKSGTGTLVLPNANTYSGSTLINEGIVNIQDANSLGVTTSEIQTIAVNGVTGSFTVNFRGFTTAALGPTIQASGGVGPTASLQNALNDLTSIGAIEEQTINGGNGSFTMTFNGATGNALDGNSATDLQVQTEINNSFFGGSPEVSVTRAGTPGNFTYTIRFDGPTVAGFGQSQITASGPGTGQGANKEGGVGGSVTVTGPVLGVYTVTFGGTLAGLNQTQMIAVGSGGTDTVVATLLDGGQGGSTVATDATLQIQGGITVTLEPLTLNGDGLNDLGVLENVSGSNAWNGPVTLGANSTIGVNLAGDSLTIGGVIGQAPGMSLGVTKIGEGTLRYTGANTYSGMTRVDRGSLQLAHDNTSIFNPSLRGDLTIGNGDLLPATVEWLFNEQVLDSRSVFVVSDGTLNLNDRTETLTTLTMTDGTATTGPTAAGILTVTTLNMTASTLTANGNVNIGSGGVIATSNANGPALITGAGNLGLGSTGSRTFAVSDGPQAIDLNVQAHISGTGTAGFTKSGTGVMLVANASNPYAGAATISQGVLEVNGVIGNVVLTGGTLSGAGTVGTINSTAATTNPGMNNTGDLTGTLSSQGLTLNSTSTFFVDLDSTTAGEFDTLNVTGDINLGLASLTGVAHSSISAGQQFVIIAYTGLRNGSTFGNTTGGQLYFGTRRFQVIYDDANKQVIVQRLANRAPALNPAGAMTLNTISEDANPNPGTLVSAMLASVAPIDPITDSDIFDPEGVAVVGVTGSGAWQFSIDGGVNWANMDPGSGLSNANARLLASDLATTLIRFVPNLNFFGAASITFRAWDQSNILLDGNPVPNGAIADASATGGATAFSTSTETAIITITPANDAPVLDDTGNMVLATINEDDFTNNGTLVSAIIASAQPPDRITDVDPSPLEGIAVISVDDSDGAWQFTTDGGVNWLPLAGALDSSAFLLAPDANTRVRFVPNANFNGAVAGLMFRAWDQTSGANGSVADASTNGGETAFSIATETASITINPLNDAPLLDNTGNMALAPIDEDQITNGGTLVSDMLASVAPLDPITEVDAAALEGIAVIAVDDTNGVWEYSINGGLTWSAFGTVSNTAARLLASEPNTRIRFVPGLNFNGTVAAGITFHAWDQTSGANGIAADVSTNGGLTAFSTATETVSITVNPINDAPVLDNTGAMTLTPVQENDQANNGTLVSAIIASAEPPDRITDVDAGALEGLAVVAVDNTNGVWQYSTNGGGAWTPFGAVANNSAVLLAADLSTRIRFVPNLGYVSPPPNFPPITFRAWDLTSGANGQTGVDTTTNGGISAFSLDTETATVNVFQPNVAPVLDNTGDMALNAIDEDDVTNNGTLVSAIIASAQPPDRITDANTIPTPVEGIAVTAIDITNGTWQFSIDDGVIWTDFVSVSDTAARLLAADTTTRVRFMPGLNFNGTVPTGITFRAWDQFSGANGGVDNTSINGGSSAYSTATETASIVVNPVNDAPTLDNTGDMVLPAIDEDTPTNGILIVDLINSAQPPDRIADIDASPLEGIAVTAVDDANGVWQYSTDDGAFWSPFGAVSDMVARLLAADTTTRVRFVPGQDFNGTVPTGLTFRAWDQTSGGNGGAADTSTNGGITAFSTATETASIVVNPINDAPVLNSTGDMVLSNINEDDFNSPGDLLSTILNSVAPLDPITDVDASPQEGIAVIGVDDTNGIWQYSTDNGAIWNNFGAVSNTAAFLMIPDANTRIRFVPVADFNGQVNLTFRAWDLTSGTVGATVDVSSNGGITAFSANTEVMTITVNPGNDAPVLDNTGDMALFPIDEDDVNNAGTLVSAIIASAEPPDRITDVDAGALEGIAVTGVDTSNGTWQFSTDSGGAWNDITGVSDNNALLLAANLATRVRFVPNANFHGTIDPGLTFRAWDQTTGTNGTTTDVSNNGGVTAFSTATESASIVVNPVNDAPVLDNTGVMSLAGITEDPSVNNGTSVTAIISSAGLDRITDVDVGAVEGIAVIGVDDTNGVWEYSTDGGASWIAFGPVSDNTAVLLASDGANTLIRFMPNLNFNGVVDPGITFRAWDQTSGSNGAFGVDVSNNGGITSFSALTETASISVTAVNDAPTFTASNPPTVNEDAGTITIPNWAAFSPGGGSDEAGQTVLAYIVTNVSNPGLFAAAPAVSNTGTLTYTLAANANGASTFDVQVQDNGGGADTSAPQTFTITVNAVNDAPSLNASDPPAVNEDAGTITVANWATFSPLAGGTSTGDDESTQSVLAYTVSNVSNLGLFSVLPSVANDGTLTYTLAPNANGASTFDVVVQDDGGTAFFGADTSAPITRTISVIAVNDAPVLDNTGDMVLPTILEDDVTNTGDLVSQIIASAGGDRITDVDVGALEGIAVVGVDNSNGVWEYSTTGGTTWAQFGSPSDTSARLLAANASTRIRFVPNAHYNGASALSFRAWDQTFGFNGGTASSSANGGATAFSSEIETVSITITPVNDAPVLDNTGAMTLTSIIEEDFNSSGTLVTSIIASAGGDRITDVDAGAVEGIAVIAADNTSGTWEYSLDDGGSWTGIVGVSDTMSLLLAANSVTRIRFIPNANFAGTVTDGLTFRAWDQTSGSSGGTADTTSNGGASAFSAATESIGITVTNTNDAPVLDNTGAMILTSIAEDATTNTGTTISQLIASAGGDRITDVDPGAVEGIAVIEVFNTNGTWQFSLNGTTWTAFGAPTETAARLLAADGNTRVRFVPTANFNGSVSTGLRFRAWDQSSGANGGTANASANGGATAFSTAIETAGITVTAQNDAPVLNTAAALSLTAINEDDVNNLGTLVTSILTSDPLVPDPITDVDPGALEGIAVIGLDSTNGQWQFSVNNGSTWTPFGAVSDTVARLLAADGSTRIRFVPNANFNGTLATGLTFRAWDRSSGSSGSTANSSAAGGASAFSSAADSASLVVNGQNDAPTLNNTGNLTLAGVSRGETNNTGTLVTALLNSASPLDVITDIDPTPLEGIAVVGVNAAGGAWEFSTNGGISWTPFGLVSDSSARLLAADANTRIRLVPNNTFSGTLVNAISFRAWDQSSGVNGGLANTSVNGGTTAFSTATETANITVGAIVANRLPGNFIDEDGETIIVRLTGPGTAAVTIYDPDNDGDGYIESIVLSGTDQRTTLFVGIVKLHNTVLLNRKVMIGEITGTGVRTLNLRESDIIGAGINLTGPIVQLLTDNINDGADVTASSILVWATESVGNGVITAASISSMTVKGDFNADLNLSGSFKGNTLNRAYITGGITSSTWDITGHVGAIYVPSGAINDWDVNISGKLATGRFSQMTDAHIRTGGNLTTFLALTFTNSSLYVGFTPTDAANPQNGGSFTPLVTLRTFRVTGTFNAFNNSFVGATRITSVSIVTLPQPDNNPLYGIVFDDPGLRPPVITVGVGRNIIFRFDINLPSPQGIGQFRVWFI